MRFRLRSVICSLLIIICAAFVPRGYPVFNFSWHLVNLGGGGLVTGSDFPPTGVRFLRTDAGGAYIWNTSNSSWYQVVCQVCIPTQTNTALYHFGFYPTTGTSQIYSVSSGLLATGVREIVGAPSDATVAYMYSNGHVLVSTTVDPANPQNLAWVDTNYPPVSDDAGGNNQWRMNGKVMAVDPNNKDHVVVCYSNQSNSAGVIETFNGTLGVSATWSSANFSTIPTPVGGQSCYVAFDPNSGTTGGLTNTVYVWTNGAPAGIYKTTTTTAGTWSLLSGSPTTMQHMIVTTAAIGQGDIWAVDGANASTSGNVWHYNGSTWSEPLTACCHSVAVNPLNGNHVVAANTSGNVNASSDGGATFSSSLVPVIAVGDAPWQQWMASRTFLTAGDIHFDPANNDVVFYNGGQGVFTWPFSTTSLTWTPQVKGVQELVGLGHDILVYAQGKFTFTAQDESGCQIDIATNASTPPSSCIPLAANRGLSAFTGFSSPPGVSGFQVGKASENTSGIDYSGYSSDGFATTYTPFNTWNVTVAAAAIANNGGQYQITVPSTASLTTWSAGTTTEGTFVCSYAATVTKGQTDSLNSGHSPLQSSSLPFPCWTITVDSPTQFTLVGSTYASPVAANYTFFAPPLTYMTNYRGAWTISNVTNDGSGKVLVTFMNSISNAITSGMPVCISGVTMASTTIVNGCWQVTSHSNLTFTLNNSTFVGGDSYISGGQMKNAFFPAGSIAAVTQTNIAVLAGDSSVPICTTDGGKTWTQNFTPPALTTVTSSSDSTHVTVASTSGISVGSASSQTFTIYLDDGRPVLEYATAIVGNVLTLGVALPSAVTGGNELYVNSGSDIFPFSTSKFITNDANAFYMVSGTAPGLYKWTGCNAPTLVNNNAENWASNNANVQVAAVPNESGHLFFTTGGQGSTGSPHPFNSLLWRTCNGDSNSAVTMQSVPGFFEVRGFGFGHPAPARDYASIYVIGWYAADNVRADAVYGIYESVNDANHGNHGTSASCLGGNVWTKINDYPSDVNLPANSGAMTTPTAISGDPFVYGPVYVGASLGPTYRTLNYLLSRDLHNDNDNTPAFLAKIA